MMRMLRFAVSLLAPAFVIVSVCASPVSVSAIESFGVGAAPARPRLDNLRSQSIFVHEIIPGQAVPDAVKIVNNTDQEKSISVYPVDSQSSSDGAFACAQAADAKKDVGGWIKLEKELITLAPHTSETVSFIITVPAEAGVGEHDGCIAVQDLKHNEAAGNGIVLSFRSALRVAVMIPGEVRANLTVGGMETKLTSKQVKVSPSLHNAGNVSLDTHVDVTLRDIFGLQKKTAGGTFPILRDTTSKFNFEVPRPFWGGWYKINGNASYKIIQTTSKENATSAPIMLPARWLFVAPQPAALAIELGILALLGGGIGFIVWRLLQKRYLHRTAVTHTVGEHENIQSIAKRYGVTWQAIARLNGLKAPYQVTRGDKLKVPNIKKSLRA